MKCIDSDFILDFLSNDSGAVRKASEIRNEKLVTTAVQVFEAANILRTMGKNEEAMETFEKFAGNIDILNLDARSMLRASRLVKESGFQRKDDSKAQGDFLIAGTMLGHGCDTIITRDAEHFKGIKGIKIESY
jgi:predicted nucleic acid-binding protein